LRERDHLEDPGVDERIILRYIFRKWDVGAWMGLIWLRIGTDGRHCKCRAGTEPTVHTWLHPTPTDHSGEAVIHAHPQYRLLE
jgi:hypothetical protein